MIQFKLALILIFLALTQFFISVDAEDSLKLNQNEDSKNSIEYNYEKIDNHVKNTPTSVETSLETLASYLIQPASNEREKARAIFDWVADNIDYDVNGLFAGSIEATTSEDVLKSRKSVCSGYSDIFLSLAKYAGLDAVSISGYGKGFDYRPGQNISGKTNHAWNAVKINGSWYLLDSTWGAGYLSEDKKYVREFNGHYFMTPPEEFIFDHLPENSSWQLLTKPKTKSEYENLVYLRSGFFKYGLGLDEYKIGTIQTKDALNISLYAPDDVLILSTLRAEQDSMSSDGLKGYTFHQRNGDKFNILARMPGKGSYFLYIYAKTKDEPGEYHDVLEYKIKSDTISAQPFVFPNSYGKFGEVGAYLYSPMDGILKANVSMHFKIRVPGAMKVAVISGNDFQFLEQKEDFFEGNITMPQGEINVAANFQGDSFDGLLKYTAN